MNTYGTKTDTVMAILSIYGIPHFEKIAVTAYNFDWVWCEKNSSKGNASIGLTTYENIDITTFFYGLFSGNPCTRLEARWELCYFWFDRKRKLWLLNRITIDTWTRQTYGINYKKYCVYRWTFSLLMSSKPAKIRTIAQIRTTRKTLATVAIHMQLDYLDVVIEAWSFALKALSYIPILIECVIQRIRCFYPSTMFMSGVIKALDYNKRLLFDSQIDVKQCG